MPKMSAKTLAFFQSHGLIPTTPAPSIPILPPIQAQPPVGAEKGWFLPPVEHPPEIGLVGVSAFDIDPFHI